MLWLPVFLFVTVSYVILSLVALLGWLLASLDVLQPSQRRNTHLLGFHIVDLYFLMHKMTVIPTVLPCAEVEPAVVN